MTSTQDNIPKKSVFTSEIEHISLLEEKLNINRCQKKVGEVVIRKEVETHTIEIPIEQEKLIVEKIGEKPELVSEVVLSEDKINGFDFQQLKNIDSLHFTKSLYLDLKTAKDLLAALSNTTDSDNLKVRIEIVTDTSEHQIEHQSICDRYTS